MNTTFITVLNYPDQNLSIHTIDHEGDFNHEDKAIEDALYKINADYDSNSHWMASEEFPINWGKDTSIINRAFYNMKEHVAGVVYDKFKENPNKQISFSERRIIGQEENEGTLKMGEDQTFYWLEFGDWIPIDLSDFGMEDLIFILEKF